MKWLLYDLMVIIVLIVTLPIQVIIMGTWIWLSILKDWFINLSMEIEEFRQRHKK